MLSVLCLTVSLAGTSVDLRPNSAPNLDGAAAATPAHPDLAPYAVYEQLRKPYDRSQLQRFFVRRPLEFAQRLADFGAATLEIKASWGDPAADGDDTDVAARGARLRRKLAELGPVAVKLGQTLSQRPDLLDETICAELKSLQTANTPFDDGQAMALLAAEYSWAGPIAPGVLPPGCAEPSSPPLLAHIGPEPIASASLGQVYRGRTHGGTEVAIKVQRPSAMRQVALDMAVITTALWGLQSSGWGNGDLVEIIDIVAAGIFEELDYRNEAANAAEYRASLEFLGYVSVPDTVDELPPTPRVIVTEWVAGRHLAELTTDEGRLLVEMAVDSVTASLVLTGYVHADPHEGNLMLGDDGRLYFLDFGLMSEVEPKIMEAFADGIQAVLNRDWRGLVDAFIATGFVGTPIQYRPTTDVDFGEGSADAMAVELQERMESVPGGTSRFGALSTVLFDMGQLWRMYTPPYIILLIRTFLTLEGIAGQVDPLFNIYEVSLPWAVQRALSPSTAKGMRALRESFLTKDNALRWDRVEEIMEEAAAADKAPVAEAEVEAEATSGVAAASAESLYSQTGPAMGPVSGAEAGESKGSGRESLDAVAKLLGSPEGATLRRIAADLDSTDLLLRLVSRDARPLRRMGVEALAAAFSAKLQSGGAKAPLAKLPTSPTSEALRQRRASRLDTVSRLLLKRHAERQVSAGWRGLVAVGALGWIAVRIGAVALLKALVRTAAILGRRALPLL